MIYRKFTKEVAKENIKTFGQVLPLAPLSMDRMEENDPDTFKLLRDTGFSGDTAYVGDIEADKLYIYVDNGTEDSMSEVILTSNAEEVLS
jgi:hypothetical protein